MAASEEEKEYFFMLKQRGKLKEEYDTPTRTTMRGRHLKPRDDELEELISQHYNMGQIATILRARGREKFQRQHVHCYMQRRPEVRQAYDDAQDELKEIWRKRDYESYIQTKKNHKKLQKWLDKNLIKVMKGEGKKVPAIKDAIYVLKRRNNANSDIDTLYKIFECYHSGINAYQTAKNINKSWAMVMRVLEERGYNGSIQGRRKVSKELEEKIIQDVPLIGIKLTSILHSVDRVKVTSIARREGLKSPGVGPPTQEIKDIFEIRKKELAASLEEIVA
jgi:hypothetical protein